MFLRFFSGFSTLGFLATMACAPPATGVVPTPTPVDLDPIGVPALQDGFFPGMLFSFSPLEDPNRAAALANQQALFDNGMRVGRVQISWKHLEPSPGQFDQAALDEALEPLMDRGVAIHFLLETIDSSSFEIPDDLLEDELTLADGMAFDDPVVLERMEALMAWLVPQLEATRQGDAPGVYALVVGNEPDNTIQDVPSLAPEVAGFTQAAREVARAHDPEMAVSMTLTLGATEPGNTYAAPIVEASDFLSINYYCQDIDFDLKTPDEVHADLDAIVRLADGRPVIFQELGCSSGFENGVVDAGEVGQVAFMETVLTRFYEDPETFRAAYWFTLMDWSPEVAGLISQPLCDEGFPDLCAAVDEAVQTYGLLRWEDGSPKAGFQVLLDAVAGPLPEE